MWKQKLCMGVNPAVGIPIEDQIRLIANTGFEAIFTSWDHGVPVNEYKKIADECGVEYQSIHAPFHKAADVSKMWLHGEAGKIASGELCRCLEICSENEIGIMVSHVYIGFKYELPNEETARIGLQNFGTVVRRAEKLGVKVAFENTEGEEFLDILMKGFKNEPCAGFCLDTGHEQCYNRGVDMLALYGDRLIATHINDNLGISSYDGVTAPRDDLHLLPFDGIIDWSDMAKRLDDCGFNGTMTFEVKKNSHAGRHNNDVYSLLTPEMYIAEAYKRACRLASMRKIKQAKGDPR